MSRRALAPGWRTALVAVLALALAFRLWGVGFGLPSLYDHDEPLFMVGAFRLLRERTLNPHWFGHPATTTFYALALVDMIVFGLGRATGRFSDVASFTAALYADPSIVWLPARLFIVGCGVACVALTAVIARRLFDPRVAIVAALLLAVAPLHIEYSQIVRSDVQASVFMMACVVFTLRMLARERTRDLVLAGVMAGLACATKWPASLIAIAPLAACLTTAETSVYRRVRNGALVGVVALVTLVVVSPYLILDFATLAANMAGEARPAHLSATGYGLSGNLGWYLRGPLRGSFGIAGLIAAGGGALGLVRNRAAVVAVVVPAIVFLVLIAAQSLIWPRWVIPLMPFVAILAAVGLDRFATTFAARWPGRIEPGGVFAALSIVVAVPMALASIDAAIERTNDTRDRAARWIAEHVERGRPILVEHIAFRMLQGGHPLQFPLGLAGCVDAQALLTGRIDLTKAEGAQQGRSMFNIGTVDPAKLPSCAADYAVFTEYDRYKAEPRRFARELAVYENMLRTGRLRAVIAPVAGVSSGPKIQIVELAR